MNSYTPFLADGPSLIIFVGSVQKNVPLVLELWVELIFHKVLVGVNLKEEKRVWFFLEEKDLLLTSSNKINYIWNLEKSNENNIQIRNWFSFLVDGHFQVNLNL